MEELYASHNSISDLFDVSLAEHIQVLDLEGNNIGDVEQLKYLRRMPNLSDISFRGNPIVKDPQYYAKIKEFVPNLKVLDDEPIGDSLEAFIEEK